MFERVANFQRLLFKRLKSGLGGYITDFLFDPHPLKDFQPLKHILKFQYVSKVVAGHTLSNFFERLAIERLNTRTDSTFAGQRGIGGPFIQGCSKAFIIGPVLLV